MRFPDWDLRLAEYIEAVRLQPFKWGKHDCLTFANNALAQQRGSGFADDFLGGYATAKGAFLKYQRWLRHTHFTDVLHGMDSRLQRIDSVYPPRGAIAAMPVSGEVLPVAFGVVTGRLSVFVGDNGLEFITPRDGFMFWGVE